MLTNEQIELRLKGVGGSEAGVVAGRSERMSALELYHVKRGELAPEAAEADGGLLAWLGHEVEPVLARWYEREVGCKVRRPRATRRHRELDWMLGHPDAFAVGRKRGIEFKMRARAEGWGLPGTDQVPDDVLLQCQHYLALFPRIEAWEPVALIRGTEIRRYEVPRDQGLIDALIDVEGEFVHRVATGQPPDLDYDHRTAVALQARLHPGTDGRAIELPPEALAWHEVLADAKAHISRYEKVADAAKAHLLELMGDAAIGFLPDGSAYHRKEVHRGAYQVEATSYVSFAHRRAARR